MIARLRTFPLPTWAEIRKGASSALDLIAAFIMLGAGVILTGYASFQGIDIQ